MAEEFKANPNLVNLATKQPEQRDSTIVKHQVEAMGIKVLRAKIDSYDANLIRLTVPTDTPAIAGEVRREIARGINGLSIPTKTWVWFKKPTESKVSVTEKVVKPFLKGIEEVRIEMVPLKTPPSPEYLDWLNVELHRLDDPIIAESKKNKGFRLFVKSIDEAKKEFVVEKDVFVSHWNCI